MPKYRYEGEGFWSRATGIDYHASQLTPFLTGTELERTEERRRPKRSEWEAEADAAYGSRFARKQALRRRLVTYVDSYLAHGGSITRYPPMIAKGAYPDPLPTMVDPDIIPGNWIRHTRHDWFFGNVLSVKQKPWGWPSRKGITLYPQHPLGSGQSLASYLDGSPAAELEPEITALAA
jgi:hypothetical protein